MEFNSMVARVRNSSPVVSERNVETDDVALIITITDRNGWVLAQVTARDSAAAPDVAVQLLERRPFLRDGDTLTVRRPASHANEITQQPRES
jgi:hypothetical protein